MSEKNTPKSYKDNFYNHHLSMSISSASEIVPLLLNYIQPTSVIDIGCGVGSWLSVWQKNGIKDIIGVDGEFVNKDELLIDKTNFIVEDLNKGFRYSRKFDIVTCLEVAEHISAPSSENLINSLCSLGDLILFSAAIPGQEGTLHINEQYPIYWMEYFKKNGYIPVDFIRKKIWSNKKISWWYRQNILLYVNQNKIESYTKLKSEAENTSYSFLNLIHPELFDYKNIKSTRYEKALKNPFNLIYFFAKSIYKRIYKEMIHQLNCSNIR